MHLPSQNESLPRRTGRQNEYGTQASIYEKSVLLVLVGIIFGTEELVLYYYSSSLETSEVCAFPVAG